MSNLWVAILSVFGISCEAEVNIFANSMEDAVRIWETRAHKE